MKKKNIILLTALILLFAGIGFVNSNIGVSGEKIEADARKSQKVPEHYDSVGEVSENVGAYLFYPEDRTDHTFSIYLNRPGFSFGYFFRLGGSTTLESDYIARFTCPMYPEINEVIYLSLNKAGAVRMEVDDGHSVKTTEINGEPFVFILPTNSGDVRFYDADGNIIKCIEDWF